MNTCSGTIRGLGKSSLAAVITFFGTCVFRIVRIYTVFRYFEKSEAIYISYPISWFITGVFFLVVVFRLLRKRSGEAPGVILKKHNMAKAPSNRLTYPKGGDVTRPKERKSTVNTELFCVDLYLSLSLSLPTFAVPSTNALPQVLRGT